MPYDILLPSAWRNWPLRNVGKHISYLTGSQPTRHYSSLSSFPWKRMAFVIFVIFGKKLKVKLPLHSKKWNMWNMAVLIMMASPVTL
jgi:hypothetical protein